MKRLSSHFVIASALILASQIVCAQVSVEDPWVRATVGQQKSTGAFMRITAAQDARLVAARSPVASVVEVHEMKMENDVMMMRRIAGLELPAGKPVELKPGGYHVMLMGLKGQIKEGERVEISLVIEGRDGKRETVEVMAPVRPLQHHGDHKH